MNRVYVVELSPFIASLVKTVALIFFPTLHTPPDPSPSVLPHSCVVLVAS